MTDSPVEFHIIGFLKLSLKVRDVLKGIREFAEAGLIFFIGCIVTTVGSFAITPVWREPLFTPPEYTIEVPNRSRTRAHLVNIIFTRPGLAVLVGYNCCC